MLDFSHIKIGKKYGRKWLAQYWGFRSYEAISRGVFCPRGGGQIILFVTRIKQKSLEQYNDYISGEYLFWEGEKRRQNDARIANSAKTGELRKLADEHIGFLQYHRREVFVEFNE